MRDERKAKKKRHMGANENEVQVRILFVTRKSCYRRTEAVSMSIDRNTSSVRHSLPLFFSGKNHAIENSVKTSAVTQLKED